MGGTGDQHGRFVDYEKTKFMHVSFGRGRYTLLAERTEMITENEAGPTTPGCAAPNAFSSTKAFRLSSSKVAFVNLSRVRRTLASGPTMALSLLIWNKGYRTPKKT